MCYLDRRAVQLVVEVAYSGGHQLHCVFHQRLINRRAVTMKLRQLLFIARLARREQRKNRHQETLVDLHRKLLYQETTVPAAQQQQSQ